MDINKGDEQQPNYRSRLVAREFKTSDDCEMFAATPPPEALRMLLSKLATAGRRYKLLHADVYRACLYAKAEKPVYVKLPAEDCVEGDEECCGRLIMSMYGTGDAAQNWAAEYSSTLLSAGMTQGTTNPCLCHANGGVVGSLVHGNVFVVVAQEENIREIKEALQSATRSRARSMVGFGGLREMRILNKVVRTSESGVQFEADPRHAAHVIRDLGLAGGKPGAVPGSKEEGRKAKGDLDRDDDEDLLDAAEATQHRGIAARLNYLAANRPDIQFATKEAARAMARPTARHGALVKKIGRYLVDKPRLVIDMPFQKMPKVLTIYSDSDWAGCVGTRKSTSGGAIVAGKHTVRSWSKQQRVV